MRKKYLSALLFGALLVTSAGTFTSCKDYDDEINNLQEQIDKVVTDLASLKSTVEKLGGYVTDVKIENGKLVVTVDGKEPVSYELPAGAEMAEIKIENGHLYVGNEDKGEVGGSKVEVNEDGVLVIDNEATEIKVGTDVVIKDASNGIYTIQIGDETIQLPMVTANVSVEATGSKLFTELGATTENSKGIYWGSAKDKVDNWKGPKGPIAKDQLLVGQISNVQLSVLPASFDLGAQDLKLVDSKGNIAPVTVDAYAADEQLNTGSRASGTNLWNLSIEMTDKVTTANAGKVFATSDNKANVKYALSVNGTIVSGYEYIVDTRINAQTESYGTVQYSDCAFNGKKLGSGVEAGNVKVEFGTTTFTYENSQAYDYYIEIAEKDINDAEKYGISVENNKIIANESAAGQHIDLVLHIVDVTGTVQDAAKTFTITVEGATVAPEPVATVEYKVDPSTISSPRFKVDLGSTFTGLSSQEAVSITDIVWENDANANANFLATGTPNTITYKDVNGQTVTINGLDGSINIKKIASVELSWNSLNTNAKVGTYNLILKLMNGTSEVKKVTVPVNVTLPTFNELFKNSDEWTDGKFNTRLVLDKDNDVPTINFTRAFVPTSVSVAFDNNFDLTVDEVKVDNVNVVGTNSEGILSLTKGAIKDNKLAATTLQVTANYNIGGANGFKVSTSKFTTNVATIAGGIQLVYLDADGKEAATATVAKNDEITIAQWDNDKKYYKNGLALKFGDKYAPLYTNINTSNIGFVLGQRANTAWTGQADKLVLAASTPNLTGVTVGIPGTSTGVVKLNGLSVGTASTLKVTVTDVMGVVIPLTINFK